MLAPQGPSASALLAASWCLLSSYFSAATAARPTMPPAWSIVLLEGLAGSYWISTIAGVWPTPWGADSARRAVEACGEEDRGKGSGVRGHRVGTEPGEKYVRLRVR